MDREILRRVMARLLAAADLNVEVTLTPEEAREVARWVVAQQYRRR